MALPRIDTPIHEMTLKSNNQKIRFRPFLVKEEKLLLMALESGTTDDMLNATKQIVRNCVLEDLDIETIPLFDIQYLFLQLRSKSVGEISEVSLRHPNGINSRGDECDGIQKIQINLNEIKPTSQGEHSAKIQLTDDIGVMMKYPTLDIYNKMINLDEEEGASAVETLFDLMADSVEYIYQGNEIYHANEQEKSEILEFLSSLNNQQFDKIRNFFQTIPNLIHREKFVCPKCGSEEEIVLSGVEDFFS